MHQTEHAVKLRSPAASPPSCAPSASSPLPVLAQPLQYALNLLPPRIRHCVPIFVCQINRVHHFAINIQLELLVGRVSDTHGPRMFVPLQMIKRQLIELLPAVNPVHHL